jgi:hypothetical protein
MSSVSPVIHFESGAAKKTAAGAISSGHCFSPLEQDARVAEGQ